MFDSIKRWFGEGKIRTEVTMDDGSTGTVKVPYIGDISTLDVLELKTTIKRRLLVEHGKKVVDVKIIGWY